MARRILGIASVVLIVLGLAAAYDVSRVPSAAEVLRQARAFVQAHPRVRFTGTITTRARDAATLTGRLEGEIETLYRSHATISWDNGDTFDTFASDYDIAVLLDAARHPRRLAAARGRTTITAAVDVADAAGVAAEGRVVAMSLRATVRRSGQVDNATVTIRYTTATTTATLHYSDWGSRNITVAEPPEAVLEGVDPDRLAQWDDAPLFMPRRIPAGWELTYARVLDARDTQEGCDQVFVAYERTHDPEHGYVNLYQFPQSCAQPFTGEGVVPFEAGPHAGSGRYSPADGALVQITVGVTTVQAESDLALAELAGLLGDLVPLDL